MENTKTTRLFLRAVEFWPTFDIQIDITLAVFWEKLQNCTFYKAHRSLKIRQHSYQKAIH